MIDNAFQLIQKEIPELTNIVTKESKKGKGFMGIQALGGTDPSKVKSLNEGIKQIERLNKGSRLPAVEGGTGPVIPPSAIQYLQKNPNTATQFDELFGEGTAQQILK
jgi:hypothetical protein